MKKFTVHGFYSLIFTTRELFFSSWLGYGWFSLPNNALELELEAPEHEDEMINKEIVEQPREMFKKSMD